DQGPGRVHRRRRRRPLQGRALPVLSLPLRRLCVQIAKIAKSTICAQSRGKRRLVAGLLIAIEGVDGAGKRTFGAGLRAAFESAGKSVAALAFPRYGRSVAADLAAEALHG